LERERRVKRMREKGKRKKGVERGNSETYHF
jgi:hypothetical protein